jgi:hypothetical protein
MVNVKRSMKIGMVTGCKCVENTNTASARIFEVIYYFRSSSSLTFFTKNVLLLIYLFG